MGLRDKWGRKGGDRRDGERRGWSEAFGDLGEAFADVVRAELAVLKGEWGRSGKRLGIAAALVLLVCAMAFWLIALLLYSAVDLATRTWELAPWQAGLAVAGLTALVMMVALLVAWRVVRRAENPLTSARQRFDDHLSWWRQGVFLETDHEEEQADES